MTPHQKVNSDATSASAPYLLVPERPDTARTLTRTVRTRYEPKCGACRVRAGAGAPGSPHRKTTDYAVWQIKVTPQAAIGPSSRIVSFVWTL